MIALHIIYLTVITGLVYAVWREHRRRCAFERAAVLDRREIREVAERAACDAAACTDVIKRFPITQERHLHLTPDQPDH